MVRDTQPGNLVRNGRNFNDPFNGLVYSGLVDAYVSLPVYCRWFQIIIFPTAGMMIQRVITTLKFAPMNLYVEAQIVSLTDELIETQMNARWWSDDSLCDYFSEPPIDLHWDWRDIGIEYGGRNLASQKVAIVTGDGAVQGAMLISTEPIASMMQSSHQAAFG